MIPNKAARCVRRESRVMQGSGALGRVVLQRRNLRIYAELHWQINKKRHSKFLCEVSADSRVANLAAGWQRARELGLTMTSNTAIVDRATSSQE